MIEKENLIDGEYYWVQEKSCGKWLPPVIARYDDTIYGKSFHLPEMDYDHDVLYINENVRVIGHIFVPEWSSL